MILKLGRCTEQIIDVFIDIVGVYIEVVGVSRANLQETALPMLEPDKVLNEMKALQRHFKAKRDYVLDRWIA